MDKNYRISFICTLVNILTFINNSKGNYVNVISLVTLVLSLLNLLNIKGKNKWIKIDYFILSAVLAIRLSCLNQWNFHDAFIVIAIILLITEFLIRCYIIKNSVENKKSIINSYEVENLLEKYIQNIFNINLILNIRDNSQGVLILNSLGIFCALIMYIGKFVIDIFNINTEIYTISKEFINIYIGFNICFFIINIIKARLADINMFIHGLEIILFLIGVDIFVFLQRGNVRLQILAISVYCCTLFLIRTKEIINRETLNLERNL